MATHSYCRKCGKCHKCSRSNSPSSSLLSGPPFSKSSANSYSEVVMQLNHAGMLGLDPNYLKNPLHKGTVYNVAIARNYTGSDTGVKSVMKWVRSSHHCSQNHFQATLDSVKVAAEIIWNFLKDRDTKGWRILINKPQIVQCHDRGAYGKKALMEPFIANFEKFNSNSGWFKPSDRTYMKILTALSHYSYSFTSGRAVLCDLQGGVDMKRKIIYLTDPVILSQKGKVYGCADEGNKAIRQFFRVHRCNHLCEHLAQPKDKKLFFHVVKTTMTNSN